MGVTEKYLELENELMPFRAVMGQAADTILDQEVSSYPIFVVSMLDVDLGVSLVNRDPGKRQKWSVRASTLEELNAKNIVQNDKVDDFRRVFKDPTLHYCLFVLSDLGAQFIFLPREN